MSGKLVVHIGPPKTATKSLQWALARIVDQRFHYAGKMQIDPSNRGSICDDVYREVTSDLPRVESRLRNELLSLLSERQLVLISEEQFLVNRRSDTFTNKCVRLRKLLADFDVRILITLRRAEEALPSYYQEMYRSLAPSPIDMNFARFCRRPISSCYDYGWVCRELRKSGFNDIRLVQYESLTCSDVSLGWLTGIPLLDHVPLEMPHKNQGHTSSSANIRLIPPASLLSFGRFELFQRFLGKSGLRNFRGYRAITDRLDRISWRRPRFEHLSVPADNQEELERSYVEAVEEFGIASAACS